MAATRTVLRDPTALRSASGTMPAYAVSSRKRLIPNDAMPCENGTPRRRRNQAAIGMPATNPDGIAHPAAKATIVSSKRYHTDTRCP